MSRAPPCSREVVQSTASREQPLHGAARARRDRQALLDEPGALQVVPAPDLADDVRVGDPHRVEPQRRVAVRVAVGERRVVDRGDPRGVRGHREQRAAARRRRVLEVLARLERVRHDHDHRRDGPERHEPLLAADLPAVRDPARDRADARRVAARELLGHGVRIVQLAAQRRLQPALLQLGRRGPPHVVRVRDVPGHGVAGPAELLLDEAPLDGAPGLAATLAAVQPTGHPGLQRGRLDLRHHLVGQRAAGELGLLLVRDQPGVDELGGAARHVLLLGAELHGCSSGRDAPSRRASGCDPTRRVRPALRS